MSDVQILSDSRDQVGESPVWSLAEQALYWVDIEGRRIHRFDWVSQLQQSWNTPERVACIALSDRFDGATCLVAAMETGVFAVRLKPKADVELSLLSAIKHPQSNMRFNDGRCDRHGRFWVSTMCMDMSLAAQVGAVFSLDETGLSAAKVVGLVTPNGMAFSADDSTYFLSDSHPTAQKIWAFDFDPQTAVISNRREFVDMTHLPGRPDGAAMDCEGCYWICGNDAGLVHQFSPGGELLQSIPVPVAKPSMCAFGGPDLDLLFVTSIQPAGMLPEQPGLNGAVFVLRPGVRGLPEPVFSRWPAGHVPID
jgi:sugar lactone lactonase YvrE